MSQTSTIDVKSSGVKQQLNYIKSHIVHAHVSKALNAHKYVPMKVCTCCVQWQVVEKEEGHSATSHTEFVEILLEVQELLGQKQTEMAPYKTLSVSHYDAE